MGFWMMWMEEENFLTARINYNGKDTSSENFKELWPHTREIQ